MTCLIGETFQLLFIATLTFLQKGKSFKGIVFTNHFSNENTYLFVLIHDMKYQEIQRTTHTRLPEVECTKNFK